MRKKLREYVSEGLLCVRKEGRQLLYAKSFDGVDTVNHAMLDFYSEVAPCGIIGSYLLDKDENGEDLFAFKHHYITQALDSDVLCELLLAIGQKCAIEIETISRKRETPNKVPVVPLQIFISVQNGRQYLMCWHKLQKQIKSFRLDYILGVEQGDVCENYDAYNDMLNRMKNHMWGVICKKSETATEHIDFTVHMDDDEDHIYRRLLREKRCGTVEKTDNNTCRFSANVYDTTEMVPWIRTFICRITELHMSNKKVEEKFKRDLEHMYRMYGIGGGDDAVQ